MNDLCTLIPLIKQKGWKISLKDKFFILSHESLKGSLYMSYSSHWISLQFPLMYEKKIKSHTLLMKLLHNLLVLNESIYMLRFALDRRRHFLLSVDIPFNEHISILVNYLLDSFLYYIDLYKLENQKIVYNLNILEKLKIEKEVKKAPGITQSIIYYYINGVKYLNWIILDSPDKNTWYLGYRNEVRLFKIYLSTSRLWTIFQIPLLYKFNRDALKKPSDTCLLFLNFLLHLNDIFFITKIGIDNKGTILFLAEIPTEVLDFPYFRLLAESITKYCNRYVNEIGIMAELDKDPNLIKYIKQSQEIQNIFCKER